MHICQNCGTEFESKFCPNCGAPAPLAKCPSCGAALKQESKFCPECGMRLEARQATPAGSTPREKPLQDRPLGASPALVTICSLLPYAVSLLFALFSVLLFLMFLGSVASSLGMGMGSIYDFVTTGLGAAAGGSSGLSGGDMSGMGDMVGAVGLCIALVAFAVFGAILAVCALVFRFSVPLRAKRMGKVRVCTYLEVTICFFYLIDFLLACVLCGIVSDEITAPGAGTVCVLVFALLFGACSAAALLVQKYLPKLFPAAAAELERKKTERKLALIRPVAPSKKLVKPKKPRYRAKECSADLQVKAQRYVKAKKLLVVFAALICLLLQCLSFFFFGVGGIGILGLGRLSPLSWLLEPIRFYSFGGMIGLMACYTLFIIIFGSIFGKKYYKKITPNYAWRTKHAWSEKWFSGIIAAFCIFLLISCIILFTKFEEYGFLFHYIYLAFCTAYTIVFSSLAGSISRKGRKLSLEVFGAIRPWKIEELEKQYIADKKNYALEKRAYLAERKAWRTYRRALAYYEEGLLPRK